MQLENDQNMCNSFLQKNISIEEKLQHEEYSLSYALYEVKEHVYGDKKIKHTNKFIIPIWRSSKLFLQKVQVRIKLNESYNKLNFEQNNGIIVNALKIASEKKQISGI